MAVDTIKADCYKRNCPSVGVVVLKIIGFVVVYGVAVGIVWNSGGSWGPMALFILICFLPIIYGHVLELSAAREIVLREATITFKMRNREVSAAADDLTIMPPS